MSAKPYHGHPSWQAWNVSLWIGNNDGLYRFALTCLARSTLREAARQFIAGVGVAATPDGARYSVRSVEHALKGLRD
jgi:hypothetical protein